MKNTFRLFSMILVVLMVFAMIPAAAIAEAAAYEIHEAEAMKRWDDVWAYLDPVEKEMLDLGATRAETTYAVYKAALNCPLIDEGSIIDLTDNEFSFTTDGMWGGYNYRVRNFTKAPAKQTNTGDLSGEEAASIAAKISGVKGNYPSGGAVDVLLVGPYYGQDSSFTDQYKNEASSIAAATGGTVTQVTSTNATGPNIAANYTNKAVVIYDSHGNCISSNSTSYLDLTTGTGLTSTDYSKGWAYNGGSFYGIDGRYIQNHVSGTLSNCIVWMAICEGMKKEGKGTTGTALLAAGAACVYGYSQSVSFTGDYKYEAAFWTQMKKGKTVAEAIATMKSTYGNWDPAYSSSSGAAWPIVMSETDAYPSNPDSAQTVTCDWTLFSTDPIALTGISVSPESVNMTVGQSAYITLAKIPSDANDYTVAWSSTNPDVVAVSGNKNGATITGSRRGTITITVTATDNITGSTYTKNINVKVTNGVSDCFVPTTEIETGVEYLIGYKNGSDVYLLMNYNPSTSNYYYNSSSNYYSYGVKAVLDASGNVTGVDASAYANATLEHAEWKFVANGSYYKINSVNNSNYYLNVYSSSSYTDLYPASGANTGSNWQWNASTGRLSYYVSSSVTKYASYIASSGSYSNLFYAPSSAVTGSSISLYKHQTGSAEDDVYTVTFVDWDGSVLKTEDVAPGASATPPADPTRTGYDFAGWSGEYTNVLYDVTVTAQYTIKTYTVTFVDWDGTVLKTQQVNYGGSATAPANPTREGYTFAGWNRAYTNVTADITVTAIYMVVRYALTINYVDAFGNAVADPYTANYAYGAAYSVTSPEVEGMTPDQAVVSGTMGAGSVTITVTYSEQAQPGTDLIGDANCDGSVDFSDAAAIAAYVMTGTGLSAQGITNADVNGQGGVTAADITALYNILFQ